MAKIIIDPVTRIEGHLKIEAVTENREIKEARSIGTLFRGIELILQGRDPRDAQRYVQRICGVCPTSHSSGPTVVSKTERTVNPPALKGQPSNGIIRRCHIDSPEILMPGQPFRLCQMPAGSEITTCQNQPRTKGHKKPAAFLRKRRKPPTMRIINAELICKTKYNI